MSDAPRAASAGSADATSTVRAPDEAPVQALKGVDLLATFLHDQGGGSLLRGWRRALDPDGCFEVRLPAFLQAAERMGFAGDAVSIFGPGMERFALADLAPEAHALVCRFKCWVRDTFSGPSKMFVAFDKDDVGRVDGDRFVRVCRIRGFEATEEELIDLFRCVDYEDMGSIAPEDVVFLEVDSKLRELETYKRKLQRQEQDQQLLVSMFTEDTSRPLRHRLRPRPWQATLDQMPAIIRSKRGSWQAQLHRRGLDARAGFQRHLCERYGNEVRAWRRALDPDETFSVSLKTICCYCRRANLGIDGSALWRSLDLGSTGAFDLEELCAEAADALAQFKKWAQEAFGSCMAMWDHPEMVKVRSRTHRNGTWFSDKKVLLAAFADALAAMQWPEVGDTSTRLSVFQSLDFHGCGFISCTDLAWLDKWKAPQWLSAKADPAAWTEVRAAMLRRFGHPLRVWRCLLDKDDSNHVSWDEFRRACRRLRFEGNVGGAWREADKDHSGQISLQEFDAPSADLLGSFKEWAERHFGSVERMFNTLDLDDSGTVSYSELKRACHRFRWEGSAQLLFNCLDVDAKLDKHGSNAGKRSLALHEIAFLDTWIPKPAFQPELDPPEAPLWQRQRSLSLPAIHHVFPKACPTPQMKAAGAGDRRCSAPALVGGAEGLPRELGALLPPPPPSAPGSGLGRGGSGARNSCRFSQLSSSSLSGDTDDEPASAAAATAARDAGAPLGGEEEEDEQERVQLEKAAGRPGLARDGSTPVFSPAGDPDERACPQLALCRRPLPPMRRSGGTAKAGASPTYRSPRRVGGPPLMRQVPPSRRTLRQCVSDPAIVHGAPVRCNNSEVPERSGS